MKYFLPLLALIALVSITRQTANAQAVAAVTRNAAAGTVYYNAEEAKPAASPETQSTCSNSRVMAKFSALFAGAVNQKWASIGDCYYVSFLNKGCKARAVFTAKGTMNYLITDLSPEQLPEHFRRRINSNYKGYAFLQAIEIAAYNAVAYQVVLEGTRRIVTLKFTADGMEELDAQTKAN
jgi:hypothetical protein